MNNPTLRNAIVTLASFIFVITVVSAWTAPTGVPPANNVSAPITVDVVSQIKSGGLGVGSLISNGSVQIGNTATACTAPVAGSVRWTGTAMEYCNGTTWTPFGGGVSSISGGLCAAGQVVKSINSAGVVTCGSDGGTSSGCGVVGSTQTIPSHVYCNFITQVCASNGSWYQTSTFSSGCY